MASADTGPVRHVCCARNVKVFRRPEAIRCTLCDRASILVTPCYAKYIAITGEPVFRIPR